MSANRNIEAVRGAARAFEAGLPPDQRKRLGQYFTDLPLGRLLAHLAIDSDTRSVLDPMAGNGDLLDATWQAARERGIRLEHLDGIEIDDATASMCRDRLSHVIGRSHKPGPSIVTGSAFDAVSLGRLPLSLYDLVITNPPYVRYQTRNGDGTTPEATRAGLQTIVRDRQSGQDRDIWIKLTDGYSGLADLSVPAWLLSGALVRPGGRLALVAPATWRSRDYADVVRYLLLRCFELEYIVEDQQPGWFSDALVRTQLIVARRLPPADAAKAIGDRESFPDPRWLQVAPDAADGASLVGALFPQTTAEREFATWVRSGCKAEKQGISVRHFDLQQEWAATDSRLRRRRWYAGLESPTDSLPLFGRAGHCPNIALPDVISDILPKDCDLGELVTLAEIDIATGQGLRTGCNRFFYVDACGPDSAGQTIVEASPAFSEMRFKVPTSILQPVLRRQSEIPVVKDGSIPHGRVLDLRNWVLPEDRSTVEEARETYRLCGEPIPRTMPDELAEYVQTAAMTVLDPGHGDTRIPELSAVQTNVRSARPGRVTPRFWYMLPPFSPRHLPAAFVPRINNHVPQVEVNLDPPLLVDANFSTFWSPGGSWSSDALRALLNSTWCRAYMEASGTPMGGGALKLEATQLRQVQVPNLSNAQKKALAHVGKKLGKNDSSVQGEIDEIVFGALLTRSSAKLSCSEIAAQFSERAEQLSRARQRRAS